MKRYAAFWAETYYPAGGWGDFDGAFDTLEGALHSLAVKHGGDLGWGAWHVVDLHACEIVKSSWAKDLLPAVPEVQNAP